MAAELKPRRLQPGLSLKKRCKHEKKGSGGLQARNTKDEGPQQKSLASGVTGLMFLKEKKETKEKLRKQSRSSSHQLRKRGHLGRKAPSPEKKKAVSEDQEGCEQTS